MSVNERTQSPTEQRGDLLARYRHAIAVQPGLTRALVSYQSNRDRPFYRWFKYKEGFSAALVEFVLGELRARPGVLLDPFAGSGAALFAARDLGWTVEGIELLPVGVTAIRARLAAERIGAAAFRAAVEQFRLSPWPDAKDPALAFQHLPITRGAFPAETERDICCFRTYARDCVTDPDARRLLEAACLSVLEAVSFTRKDGQYLRWDVRAGRAATGRRFSKGEILDFGTALERQLAMMLEDMSAIPLTLPSPRGRGSLNCGAISVRQGSCLQLLPTMEGDSVDLVVTSPPYCNRYDYTRTYALELAFLGVDGQQLKELRQSLLSCTVENQTKVDDLATRYSAAGKADLFGQALAAFHGQAALAEVLDVLEEKNRRGELNNPNVPRMVRNYFLESAMVIFELARILRPGGRVVMVNDNVQYAGEEVPVDLILCELAAAAGLHTEHLWTLGRGKGNSSQQMGRHGRHELRKCAYVWQK